MKRTWVILKKELGYFFSSPIGYIVLVVFTALANFWYIKDLFLNKVANMEDYFRLLPLALVILVPAVTMRTWAEERKSGTIELLTTSPVNFRELVLGKFLSNWIIVVLGVYLSIGIPITLVFLGDPDKGVILAGYIAASLLAAAYVAVGQFISVVSKNQIVALIIGWVSLGFMYALGFPQFWPKFKSLASLFGTGSHFESISKGLIDTRDLLYYLSLIVIFLILTNYYLNRLRK